MAGVWYIIKAAHWSRTAQTLRVRRRPASFASAVASADLHEVRSTLSQSWLTYIAADLYKRLA